MKEVFVSVIAVVVLMSFVNFAQATIGVTPASFSVNFESSAEKDFSFKFFSDQPTKFEVKAEGDLAQYVDLSTDHFNGQNGVIDVKLKLPDKISTPGVHRILISARQVPESKKGMGIVGAIEAVIFVDVPYPGQYAEIDFGVDDANAGQDVNATLHIASKGVQSISTNSRALVYDSQSNLVDTIPFGNNEIASQDSVDIYKILPTSSYSSGNYRALAEVDYGSGVALKNASFRLGTLYVNMTNYTQEVVRGKINKFRIDVQSFWNDPLPGVYADVSLYNNTLKFVTPSADLERWGSSTLEGFFDTTAIEGNSFSGTVTLHYMNQTSTHNVTVHFKNEIPYLLYGVIVGALVLILVFVIMAWKLFTLERRLNKENNGKGKTGKKK